jgi:hypothetical protein
LKSLNWLEQESKSEIPSNLLNLEKLSKTNQISLNNIMDKKYISPKYYKIPNLPDNIISIIESENFNIFNLEEKIGSENTLPIIGSYILKRYNLFSKIDYEKFESFIEEIRKGYNRENPYHTDLHAADVTQTCLIYILKGKMKEIFNLNDLDIASIYISCMIHDYKHPGYNNLFLININSPVSIRHNDTNVLEAYHISQTYKLIKSNEKYNIFSLMNNEEYKYIRKRMIGLVLATDMIFHFKQLEDIKNLIKEYNIKKGKNREKIKENNKLNDIQQQFLEILIHACDISNPTKTFNIYNLWANKVMSEFFRQGDKEKELGLKVSMNCDRLTTTLPQCQIGFMNFIVGPLFISIVEIFPELNFLVENLNNNVEKYKKIHENYLKKQEK